MNLRDLDFLLHEWANAERNEDLEPESFGMPNANALGRMIPSGIPPPPPSSDDEDDDVHLTSPEKEITALGQHRGLLMRIGLLVRELPMTEKLVLGYYYIHQMRTGDILLQINRKQVAGMESVEEILLMAKNKILNALGQRTAA